MERAKENLGDKLIKVDDCVVNVAASCCNPALFEPNLVARVNCKEEFGWDFVKAFFCFEAGSVLINHGLE